MKVPFNTLQKYYHFVAGLSVFSIYLFTLSPTVIQIDSGELAAVQANAGIAHPTGYPLFTLSGFIFVNIPFPFPKILMANVLAALFCSAAVMVFILSAEIVFSNREVFASLKKEKQSKKKKQGPDKSQTIGPINGLNKIFAISGGAFILAFSKTFWFQSTSVEVYSLHIFLVCTIIYFLLKAFLAQSEDLKHWIFFAISLALGFTNHMTILLLIPASAYLYFYKKGFSSGSFKFAGKLLFYFVPVLIAVYSYLPLRASANPSVNWGNPINMENIVRHITGAQYQVWLFSSFASAKKQFAYFFNNLPGEFGISGLLFVIIGIFYCYAATRKFFILLAVLFLSTVLYSINYDIVDIDAYFILAYVALAFFAVMGIYKLLIILQSRQVSGNISAIFISIIIIIQIIINWGKVSQSGNYIFEDYTKALINSTGKNSIIFSYQWDYFISASYYFQYVEGFRKDAAVIDKELLRRSWYYNQLNTNYPRVLEGIKTDIHLFNAALKPFERDENFNPQLLERLYRNLMTNLIGTNADKYPFYIAPELFENEMQKGELSLPAGYFLVPDLFLFKVVKGKDYVPAKNPDFLLRIPSQRNHYTAFIENTVGSMLVRRAMYELQFDRIERARVYINKIRRDLPHYKIPYDLQNVIK